MSCEQRAVCAEYYVSERKGRCHAGHVQMHPLCRGVVHDRDVGVPSCLKDEVPPHLLREDGMPLGWPIKQDKENKHEED